ncbi:SAM-dependent methyltransferase [Nocardiopsis composta]|uniref:SAM-dependent methyltransferase n=1 Tax=Nocardiopsis composta TaxID=157465 RepID=A0A7W8QKE8_9ACTN|nr:SAM-dependent methyltransferase [Nocardiopsis composta]MBB5432097.1 SAM-dependent methyltransferase [Nocardiopsis composta]
MAGLDPPEFLKRTGQKYREPPEIDMTRPSIARVYSYYLGGKDHFEVDREMANYAEGVVPGVTDLALGNRAFVQRATRHLTAEAGLDQFLDIGSGLPSDGNVHEIVRKTLQERGRSTGSPHEAKVVYVDSDPMVLAHGRALLADDRSVTVVRADLTEPDEVLARAVGTGLIDVERPVGLILGGILHHLHDEQDPAGCTRRLLDALAPGSHVVISHFCRPDASRAARSAERAEALERAFREKLGTGRWRTEAEIAAYFHDWPLVPPGLVPLNDWHPQARDGLRAGSYSMPVRNRLIIVGGVARKP